MPPPRKIDRMPKALRRWLREELKAAGFGDHVELSDRLNDRLAEAGEELTISKSAVGRYAQLLKDQDEAQKIAEGLMVDIGIEEEAGVQRAIMHMIAAQAVQLMADTREAGGTLDAKTLGTLGKMLKDLMGSAGIRERMRADERERVAKEERERVAETAETAVRKMGLTAEAAKRLRNELLGVPG